MASNNRGNSNYRGKKPYKKPQNYGSRKNHNNSGSKSHYNSNRNQYNGNQSRNSNSNNSNTGYRDSYSSGNSSPYTNSGTNQYHRNNSYNNGNTSPYQQNDSYNGAGNTSANFDDEDEEQYDPASEPVRSRSNTTNNQNKFTGNAFNSFEHQHQGDQNILPQREEEEQQLIPSPHSFSTGVIGFINRNLRNYNRNREHLAPEVEKQHIDQKVKKIDDFFLAIARGVLVNIKSIKTDDFDLEQVKKYGDMLVMKKLINSQEHYDNFAKFKFLMDMTVDAYKIQGGGTYQGISQWDYDVEMDKMKDEEKEKEKEHEHEQKDGIIDFHTELFDAADFENLNTENPTNQDDDLPDFEEIDDVNTGNKSKEHHHDIGSPDLPDFEEVEEDQLFVDSEPATQQSEIDQNEQNGQSIQHVDVDNNDNDDNDHLLSKEIAKPVDDSIDLIDFEELEKENEEIVIVEDSDENKSPQNESSKSTEPMRPNAPRVYSTDHVSPLSSRAPSLSLSLPTGPKSNSKPTGPQGDYSQVSPQTNNNNNILPSPSNAHRSLSRNDETTSTSSSSSSYIPQRYNSGHDSYRSTSSTQPRSNSGSSPSHHHHNNNNTTKSYVEPPFNRRSITIQKHKPISSLEQELIDEKARKRRKLDNELLAGPSRINNNHNIHNNGFDKNDLVVPQTLKLSTFINRIESEDPFEEIQNYTNKFKDKEPISVSRTTMNIKEKYINRIRELCS